MKKKATRAPVHAAAAQARGREPTGSNAHNRQALLAPRGAPLARDKHPPPRRSYRTPPGQRPPGSRRPALVVV